ncbi:MAG: hypothetical protein HY721_28485, partial [Planctomycetes bacterium]|nr:hypothetical protein [Planctomycetota bacterium]
MPLLAPALALLIPCQVPETQLAKQSRSFFEGLVEIKLAAKHLVFKPSGAALDVSSLMARARSAFPDASSIHVRSSSGSSST